MNDVIESALLKTFFGEYASPALPKHLLVSSTKSMMGHALGAAGGIEAAIAALTIEHGIVPPTINLDNPAVGCDLDYVAHQARNQRIDVALSQSFGFGGGNVVLALKRYS
jgi:3-oxoacyl-[acyl-carrier-protein] synthase II